MPLVSVGLADLRVLHPPVIPQRWDLGGSQATHPSKSCAVINIGTNFPPFMEHSCTDCPAGTGYMHAEKTVQLTRAGRKRCIWSSVGARKPKWPLYPGVAGGPCDAFHNFTGLKKERNAGLGWRGDIEAVAGGSLQISCAGLRGREQWALSSAEPRCQMTEQGSRQPLTRVIRGHLASSLLNTVPHGCSWIRTCQVAQCGSSSFF